MDPFHHLNASFSNPYHPLLSPSPPHHFHPLPPPAAEPPPQPSSSSLPQWSHAETAAFLAIRAELDHSFLATKRNKALWEAVSACLAAQGFARTPDQCKSKWKNLVTRWFKGTEAAAAPLAASAAARQFPFHEEMRRIFDARAERARALEERNDKAKGKHVRPEDDEGGEAGEEEDDDNDDEEEVKASQMVGEEERGAVGAARKRRRKQQGARTTVISRPPPDQGEVEAMLREFMRRQVEMEERWTEAREAERRAREEEWRIAMVALGEERLALVRRWRDREDAWRARARRSASSAGTSSSQHCSPSSAPTPPECRPGRSSIHTLTGRYGPKPRTNAAIPPNHDLISSLLHAPPNQCNVQNGLLLF